MARKVKCLNCNKQGDTLTFHKEIIKDKNRYFCNEFEYMDYLMKEENKLKIKNERNELITWIVEKYYAYEAGMIFPTTLSKRLNPLFNFYPLEVIKEAFTINDEVLLWAAENKEFTNEFGKTAYYMTIVEGSINDVYKAYNKKQKDIKFEEEKTTNVDLELFEEIKIENVKVNNSKDISRFLED